LVGDWAQLQSVTAGGAFSLLVHDRDDAPELVDVHRFVNEWEKTASLDLRHGRTEAIDAYAEHDRITGGDTEAMIDAAYTAWRNDTLNGALTVLIADSNESVHSLNQRARADLILDGIVDARREVALHGDARAGSVTRSSPVRTTAGSAPREGGYATATVGRSLASETMDHSPHAARTAAAP
jgi:hypothetical protein